MIKPSDLDPLDASLAARIIATARSIAPCLDSLVDGGGADDPKPKTEAIAILKGVGTEGAARGSRLIKRQNVGPAGVEYFDAKTWFTDDDRAALRALCSATSDDSAGHPIGEFPKTSRIVSRMFPEEC